MKMTIADYRAYQARRLAAQAAPAVSEGCDDEGDLHEQIERELKRRGLYYVHSRMDMRTTTAKGVPDFIVAARQGVTLWIEAKTAKGKLRTEQIGAQQWLEAFGHKARVVRSFQEFLNLINV